MIRLARCRHRVLGGARMVDVSATRSESELPSQKLFFWLIVPTLAWIKRRIVQATILRERADAVTAGELSKETLVLSSHQQ